MAFPLAHDDVLDAPPAVPAVPDSCPRCGADFELDCALREVSLTLTTGDQEWDEAGWECACCGWCTEARPGTFH